MTADDQLKKDYFWNTLGVLLQSLTLPILLVLVTRINGIAVSGDFSFMFAIALLLWAFGVWGGRTFQVSDTKGEFSQLTYIVARILLAAGMLVFAIIFIFMHGYDDYKSALLLLLVAYKACESIADALYGVMQINHKLYKSGISLTTKAVLGVGLFAVANSLTHDLLWGVGALLFVNVAIVMIYDLPLVLRRKYLTSESKSVRHLVVGALRMLRKCWAIFATVFVVMFTLNIPRYFLELYHPEEMGYFGVLVMPMSIIALVMMFILQPVINRLTQLIDEKKYGRFKNIVKKISLTTFGFGLVVLAGSAIIGVPLLEMIFSVRFEAYYWVLLIVMIGGTANALASMYINILIVLRRFREQFTIIVATNLLLVGGSFYFIEQYRSTGAAWLYCVASIVQLFLLWLVYRFVVRGKGA